jgi:DNA-binding transcriptional ArsR family regulator
MDTMGAGDDAPTRPEDDALGVRLVDDAATFKALADPVRLAMLRRMMDAGDKDPQRLWTAKELAAALDEPQTKLYRHLKVLEECGLIRVAETRLVSGIVEQRYVAAQGSLEMGRDFMRQSATRGETADLLAAGIDAYRRQLLAAVRSGRVHLKADAASAASYRRPLMMFGDVRLPPDRASEFRDRLGELIDEYVGIREQPAQYQGADGVTLGVMVGCFDDTRDPLPEPPPEA